MRAALHEDAIDRYKATSTIAQRCDQRPDRAGGHPNGLAGDAISAVRCIISDATSSLDPACNSHSGFLIGAPLQQGGAPRARYAWPLHVRHTAAAYARLLLNPSQTTPPAHNALVSFKGMGPPDGLAAAGADTESRHREQTKREPPDAPAPAARGPRPSCGGESAADAPDAPDGGAPEASAQQRPGGCGGGGADGWEAGAGPYSEVLSFALPVSGDRRGGRAQRAQLAACARRAPHSTHHSSLATCVN